jgi:hypothetical protein
MTTNHLPAGRRASRALVGDLSIVTADGTTLQASTDLALAELWAAHELGDAAWSAMPYGARVVEIGAALRSLRAAANEVEL